MGTGRDLSLDRVVPWFFLAGGAVVLVIGLAQVVLTAGFLARAEPATGTVVRLARETDSEGTVLFFPVVRFTTAEGEATEFTSGSGSSPPSETPGDRVDVLYDPDNPSDARLSSFVHLWLGPAILLPSGAGLAGGGLLLRKAMLGRPPNVDRVVRWVPQAFLVVGLGAVIVGAVWAVSTVRFLVRAERTTGTVVQLSEEYDSEREQTLYYPVVRFSTAEGETIEFISTHGSTPPSAFPGDQVDVLYDPDDPYAARIGGFLGLWLGPAIAILVGAFAMGVGWFIRGLGRGPGESPGQPRVR